MSQSMVSGALACGTYRRANGHDRIRPCCCGRQLCLPHARDRTLTSNLRKQTVGVAGGYLGLGSLPQQVWAQACHSSPHVLWPLLPLLPACQTHIQDLQLLQPVFTPNLAFWSTPRAHRYWSPGNKFASFRGRAFSCRM